MSDKVAAAGHAFISYVHEDAIQANMLQDLLETAGIPVWRDTTSLWPGQNWRREIRRAIQNDALAFLACFSSNSVTRDASYQYEELRLAISQLRRRRPGVSWLIPIRFDECEIPDLEIDDESDLSSLQCADLFGAGKERNSARLIESVRRILGHHHDPPAASARTKTPEQQPGAKELASPGAAEATSTMPEDETVRELAREAAERLRSGRYEAFRRLEGKLALLGTSARPSGTLRTSKGVITVQLLPDYTPRTVSNFIGLATGTRAWTDPKTGSLVSKPLYDGTIFHRVIPSYLIQGGDPTGYGTGGPGYVLDDEISTELRFDQPYLLAMSNDGRPNSNGSQFFLTAAPAPQLTGRHTIFGIVLTGQSVIDEISVVPTEGSGRPVDQVVLEALTIEPPPG